jgi:hypothetical protein
MGNKIAVAQAKVAHILRPGKASEKTPKGVIPPSLCEISQKASRKKTEKKTKPWKFDYTGNKNYRMDFNNTKC